MKLLDNLKNSSIPKEVVIRSIKIIDIAYLSVIYATIVITLSVWIDTLIGPIDENVESKKNIIRVILECWAFISLIAVLFYIVRNIVEKVPFPMDGMYGFVHSRVKEITGGPIFGFLIFFYAKNLRTKIELLIVRSKSILKQK